MTRPSPWARILARVAPRRAGIAAAKAFLTPRVDADAWSSSATVARVITLECGVNALLWGSGGPSVLLMHGWNGQPGQFAGLASRLVAAERRVIALAAPGHGSPARAASVAGFADALRDVGRELGPLEAVVGHSMGAAAVALAVARGLQAKRLALLACPAALTDAIGRHADALALPRAARRACEAEVDRRLGVSAARLDVTRVGHDMPQPTLLVHDRSDRVVPFADAERIAAAWPAARLQATTGLGHVRLLGDRDVLTDVADFVLARAPATLRPLARIAG